MRRVMLVVVLGLVTGSCDDGGSPADTGVTDDGALAADAARPPDAGEPDAGEACPPWPDAPWNQAVNAAPLHPRSAEMIAWLAERGWGNNGNFQIDFSIEVLQAGPEVVPRAFEPNDDHYLPDCDLDPVPVPPGGALEGEDGYACDTDGDCHLIVQQGTKLYEMWRADIRGADFSGGCLAVWDTTARQPATGRGEQCTSADAAGLPIAPLLFSADDVAAGAIDHAIRFILPNDRIRNRAYVRPATHATGAAQGGDLALPYGARLRLRADYPVANLPAGAQVVARALQRYGMFLVDGGQIALTGQSDRFTTAKWVNRLESQDLRPLQVSDFEVLGFDAPLRWTGDCVRSAAVACP